MDSQVEANMLRVAVQNMRYASYVDVSSMVILVYDYAITFDKEKSLMWSSPRSFAKVMFFLTRYLPFVDTSIVIWQLAKSQMSTKECALAYNASFWLLALGILGAEIILAFRTWAVYECSRRIAFALSVWTIIMLVPMLVLGGIGIHRLGFSPLPSYVPGCLIVSGKTYTAYIWIFLALFEAGVLVLMLIKAFRNFRTHGHSEIYKRVYADGSLFYVYLFVLSAANTVVALKHPPGLENLLSSIERVIHSVMTGRILLNLRKLGVHDWGDDCAEDEARDGIGITMMSYQGTYESF